MNNKYKKAISEIEISEEQERKILSMAINRKKKGVLLPKFAYPLMLVVLIGIVGFGTVYAKDIVSYISTVLSFEDGTTHPIGNIHAVKINEDTAVIKYNEDGATTFVEMTVAEVEKTLGIDILTSDMATSNILYYKPLLSGKKIGRVDLWYPGFIDDTDLDRYIDAKIANGVSEDEYQALEAQRNGVALSVSFITEYADEGYVSAFEEGIDAGGGKKIEATYHIDSLNVDAIIYTYDWSNTRLVASFVYDNMLYQLYGNNITQEEMVTILDSLK